MQFSKIRKNIITQYAYWRDLHRLLHCILTILLSALSFYFSTEYWCFSWIALLILCLYALKRSLVSTFMVAFFFVLIGIS